MSVFEIQRVLTEKLFDALKAIETLAEGTMKVYGLSDGQGKDQDRQNDMALTCGWGHIMPAVQARLALGHSGPIVPAVQALALRQSINLHSALR